MPSKKYPLYQPRITDENVRRLYRLKERVGLPMTTLVNEILKALLDTGPADALPATDQTGAEYPLSDRGRGG